jgi:transposase
MDSDCMRPLRAENKRHFRAAGRGSRCARKAARTTRQRRVGHDIRRKTHRRFSAEEKIRIVLEGLRGEESIATLCRKEGLAPNLYYRWSREFLEAGKNRLVGDTTREATSTEVADLLQENARLKQLVSETVLENRLIKESVTAAHSDVEVCE